MYQAIVLGYSLNNSFEVSPLVCIGLFKMFSHWIFYIFTAQIQSQKGHKLMKFMLQNKDKDLLGIYQCGYDPFCVSLLTDRHLKVRCHTDFV